MKITITNRKNADDAEYARVNVNAIELITALWNKPGINKSIIFKNKEACISEKSITEKINKKIDSKKTKGPAEITIGSLKHDGAKKNVGVTLKGKYTQFGPIWDEAIINQEVFFKYRREFNPNKFLSDIVIKLHDDNIEDELKTKVKQKAKEAEKNKPDPLRPDPKNEEDEDKKKPPVNIEPKKDDDSDNSQDPNQPEPEKTGWFGSILRSPILHGIVAGAVTGAALFFARVATWITATASFGVAALTWGIESLYFWRKNKMAEGYEEYDNMSPSEISRLDPEVKKALNTGLESKNWLSWGKSAFDTTAWKNYKAYGAGLKASEKDDDMLANKIRLRAKVN